MIGEPPPTQADLHFSIFGIPVRVHPFFWLITLMLGLDPDTNLQPLLIWVGAVFISILVHELGHAATARAFGWNSWIVLYSFGGLASYQPTYDDTRKQVLITLAGPGAGFLFAAIILAVMAAAGSPVTFVLGGPIGFDWWFDVGDNQRLAELIDGLLFVNIFWGLMNLLPVYPLDGGRVARELLGSLRSREGIIQAMWLSIITGGIVAVVALLRLGFKDGFFIALMFGYFAYLNYAMLQAYTGRGRYGDYGGRGW